MRHAQQDALERWLAAERDDRADEAEGALLELFEALPLVAPPAGFADRVLVRAGLQGAKRDLFAWRPLRIVLALCLVAAGFGVLWLPPVLLWLPRVLAGFASVSGAVRVGTRQQMRFIARAMAARGWLDPEAVPEVESLSVEITGPARDELTGTALRGAVTPEGPPPVAPPPN